MEKPTLRITPKKYAGETTIVSMRMSKELLKDIDAVANIVKLRGCSSLSATIKMPGRRLRSAIKRQILPRRMRFLRQVNRK